MKGCPCCARPARCQHLMCATCWQLVPSVEQRAVNDTWRRYRRAGNEPRDERNRLWHLYEQARQAAITKAQAANQPATL